MVKGISLKPKFFSLLKTTSLMVVLILLLSFNLHSQELIDHNTGHLSLEVTDLEVHAGAILLQIQRSLYQAEREAGLLGSRWLLNWESKLLRSESVIIVWAGNKVISFSQEEDKKNLKGSAGEMLVLKESGQAVLSYPDGIQMTYDSSGHLIGQQDANGNTIKLHYGENGSLERIVGPRNTWLNFRNDDTGRAIQIEASTGDKVDYSYEGGYLVKVQVNNGAPMVYDYNRTGALIRIDHPQTGSTRLAFDAKGRITSRIWADGSEEFYEYVDSERLVRHISPEGGVTTYKKNESGRQTEITDPLGHKTVITYNESFLPVTVTGPTGAKTRMSYDSLGRTIEVLGCCGAGSVFDYVGDSNRVKSIMESDGTRYDYAYDDKGNLLSIEKDNETIYSFSYFSDGLMESMQGLDLPKRTFSYHTTGLLKSETDALGHTTTFEYDKRGKMVKETNPLGGETVWTYNDQGRILQWKSPGEATWQCAYDKKGRRVKVINPTSGVTQYEYDVLGRFLSITDPEGRTTRYHYDAAGRLTKEIDPSGGTYQYQYDQGGNLIREMNPLGGVTYLSCDSLGNLTGKTDPFEHTWKYSYSKAGLVNRILSPTGATYQYHYDDKGLCKEEISPNGLKTLYEHDDRGRIVKVSFPDGNVKTYEYDKEGNVVLEKDNWGADINYEYDELNRLIKERTKGGYEISYKYDALGNLLRMHDNSGSSTDFKYNSQGFMYLKRDIQGATSEYRYDFAGRLLEEIDPLGYAKSLHYSKAGELKRVVFPSKDEIKYEYDQNGNISEIYYPDGGKIQLSFDPMGNLITVADALGTKTRNSYDDAGRLVAITDAKGQATKLTYDSFNRIVKKNLADGKTVQWKYDPDGNILKEDDGSFPVCYAYDSKGRLSRIDYPAIKKVLRYEYDETGLPSKFIDSEGNEVGYEYDSFKRLESINLKDGRAIKFAYDVGDRLTNIVYPNGIEGGFEYDAMGRLVQIAYSHKSGNSITGWHYSYDAAGNLIKKVDSKGKTTFFHYDITGQLIEESYHSTKVRYSYLPGGNRGEKQANERTIKYRYNETGQLQKAGEVVFKHDANGNLIERSSPSGATTYSYDKENRLVKVVKPDGNEINFGYAPTGDRIWRKDSAGFTYFITDGTNLIAQLDENLDPKATYVHGPGIDFPLMLLQDNQRYFYHADLFGSIDSLTDSNGKVSASYKTDVFGNIIDKKGSLQNPFIFIGREYESDLGLYYCRARYYDPALGRFLTEDPNWVPTKFNRYIYALNAPTRYIDPMGLDEIPPNWFEQLEITSKQKDLLLEWETIRTNLADKVNVKFLRGVGRIKPGPPLRTKPPMIREIARHDLKERLINAPDNLKGEALMKYLRRSIEKDIIRNRRILGKPKLKRVSVKKLHEAPISPSQRMRMQLETGGQKGAKGSAPGQATGELSSDQSSSGSDPPPAAGAGGAAAGGSKSSSISIPSRPRPGWNPDYRGPTGMNRGPDANNWKPISSKKPPGSGTSPTGQSPQWHQRHATPILTVLLSTEMILRCRNEGLTVGQCADRALKAAAVAAGIALTVATIPATAPVIFVTGVGLMTLKCYLDLVNYRYELENAREARERLAKIEKKRKILTEANLQQRLEEDLSQLRERIKQSLEGPVRELGEVCGSLERIIQDARVLGDDADQLSAEFPTLSNIDKWQEFARRCKMLAEINQELETINASLQTNIQKARAEILSAESIDCDSEAEATQIRQSYETAGRILAEVDRLLDRVSHVQLDFAQMKSDISMTRSELNKAMSIRDKLTFLTSGLPSYESVKSLIEQGKAAKDTLLSRAKQLEARLWRLQKGYPDDMASLTEQRFFQLRDLVNVYKFKVKCDPESFLAQFNTSAEKIVKAKLRAEDLLGIASSLDAELSTCDIKTTQSLINSIEDAKYNFLFLEGQNRTLLKLAEECEEQAKTEPNTLIFKTEPPGELIGDEAEKMRKKADTLIQIIRSYAKPAEVGKEEKLEITAQIKGEKTDSRQILVVTCEVEGTPLVVQPYEIEMGQFDLTHITPFVIPKEWEERSHTAEVKASLIVPEREETVIGDEVAADSKPVEFNVVAAESIVWSLDLQASGEFEFGPCECSSNVYIRLWPYGSSDFSHQTSKYIYTFEPIGYFSLINCSCWFDRQHIDIHTDEHVTEKGHTNWSIQFDFDFPWNGGRIYKKITKVEEHAWWSIGRYHQERVEITVSGNISPDLTSASGQIEITIYPATNLPDHPPIVFKGNWKTDKVIKDRVKKSKMDPEQYERALKIQKSLGIK